MERRSAFFGTVVVLAVVLTATWLWQHGTHATLLAELENRRDLQQERKRLEKEREHGLSQQISTAELERLRSDHAAVSRLRGEIDATRRQAEATKQNADKKSAEPKPYEPSIMDGPMPASMWRNAGSATPAATIETALWAAAGGDVVTLGRMVTFDVGAREKALALLAELPPGATGQDFDSPEKLIASMTIRDVPLGSARLIDTKYKNGEDVMFMAQLSKAETGANPKRVILTLRQEGESWKLVVPAAAVEKYRAQLKTSGVPPAGAK